MNAVLLGYLEGHKEHCSNKSNPDHFMILTIEAFGVLTVSKNAV